MKKLLLFVIACTLGLFGTVNAQETITVGEGSVQSYVTPVDVYSEYYLSQQIYTADEIAAAGGSAGTITQIGFNRAPNSGVPTRNWSIYLTNTTESSFPYETFLVSPSDKVFSGSFDICENWNTFDLTAFEYTGGNLLVTVVDNTGTYDGDVFWYGHASTLAVAGGRSSLYNPESVVEYMSPGYTNRNQIQLTFAAAGEGGEEGGEELASEFSFDFEDGTLTGLRAFAGEGSNAPLWAVGDVGNGTGIFSMSYDPVTWITYADVDNYVVTENQYQITENSVLSWYLSHSYPSYAYADVCAVVVSEDGETFTTVEEYQYDETATTKECSLAAYAGKNLYVGFRHYCVDEYGGESLILDDIKLSLVEGGETPDPTPEPEPEPEPEDICTLVLTMTDTYGDGWNGNYLVVEYGDVSQQFDFSVTNYTVKEYSKEYTLEIPQGTNAKATYTLGGNNTYPSENGFTIAYEGGKEAVSAASGTLNATTSFEFYVSCIPTAPEKPVITATATGGSTIVLTMSAAEADSYNVYQNGEVLVEGLTETTYTVEGLTASTEYCYTVVAVNEIGESELSEEACATTEEEIEEPTGDLCVIDITLEDSYGDGWNGNILKVEYGTTSKTIEFPNGATMTETMEIPSGTHVTVTYQKIGSYPEENSFVVAYESGEEILNVAQGSLSATTSWEFVVDCTPAVPETPVLAAEATSDTTIVLTWAAVEGATSYNVYSADTLVANVTETTYTVEGLTAETEYTFVVKAVNEVGESEASNVATAKTLAAAPVEPEPVAPAAPTNVVATADGQNSIIVTWNAVDGASEYNIYHNEELISVTNTTSDTIEGLTESTEYCFAVTALFYIDVEDETYAFESELSETVCATTEEEIEVPEDPDLELPEYDFIVTIGSGDTMSSSLIPYYGYYDYSVSQQIYTAEEIGVDGGIIKSIAFKSASENTATRNISVFMKNTTKDYFESDTDWIDVSENDLVYEGPITTTGIHKWCGIELTEEFVYGGDNILLFVVDNTGQWSGEYDSFYIYLSSENTSLYHFRDGDNYDPYNLSASASNILGEKNYIQFTFAGINGPMPTEFFYDFEDLSLEDWTTIDADGDGHQWLLDPTNSTLVSYSYNNGGYLYPDNYIFTTSKYKITEMSNLSFSHTCADYAYNQDKFAVVISEDGINFNIVWEYLYTENSNSDWENVTIDLSSYAGKALHIGFRHFDCNGEFGTGVSIDNIKLATEDIIIEPEPTVPAAPDTLVASVDGDLINLYWTPVENATEYGVYQVLDEEYHYLGSIYETEVQLQAPMFDTEYCFAVTAYNEWGESEYSGVVCVYVPAPPAPALTFSYNGNKTTDAVNDIEFVRDINASYEIQFDLEISNNTANDMNVVCEVEDLSNIGQSYICWGNCYTPGTTMATNTVYAGGDAIFNGHAMFVDEEWNELPKGTVIPVRYTFYDESNPSEKYVFNVNFIYNTTRNVLIEEFTGRLCAYCPMGHAAINDVMAENPGKVFAVNYHVANSLSPTSYPNLNTSYGNVFFNAWNIPGIPSALVNRNNEVHPASEEFNNNVNSQLSQLTEVKIEGNVAINSVTRQAEITVELDYLSNSNYSKNYLTIMMLQDSIFGSQSGADQFNPEQIVDGQYCHMHVLRDVITNTWGDAITPTTAGTHITKKYIYEIPEVIGTPNGVEVDLDNIYFLAFVTEKQDGTPTRPVLNVNKLVRETNSDEPITPQSPLTFLYEGNDVTNSINNIVIEKEINGALEIQFDLVVGNNTANDMNVVCEKEDLSNVGQSYICWGNCYMPGITEVVNTVYASSSAQFNGHTMFVDEEWNELPKGTVIPVRYTFYDEKNPSEKYVFNVKFIYENDDTANYWTPDESLYANNMTIITTVEIDGEEQYNPNLELGAFCNGELRGSARLQYVDAPANRYECFLMVYGNSGDDITFRLYDHGTGLESDLKSNEVVDFEVNASIGDVVNPYSINFVSTVLHSRDLTSGWNWYSTYIVNKGAEGLTNLETAVGTNGIQIKNQTKFVNQASGNWYGTLTSTAVEDMFMIQMSAAHTLELEGYVVNPAEHPITLGTNWKWISYPLAAEMSVEDAFASANPSNGDYVKSQKGFAQYYDGLGWSGTLQTMTPGMGYMYQNTAGYAKTLVYPMANAKSKAEAEVEENLHWTANATKYPMNMTVIAVVEGMDADYEVAAFSNGECRGSARPVYIEALGQSMIFLTIYGDDNEAVSFRYYDVTTDEEVALNDEMRFEVNATHGDVMQPYVMTLSTMGIDEASAGFNIYPNPVQDKLYIETEAVIEEIVVYDVYGRVQNLRNSETQKLRNSIDVSNLNSGVYFIQIKTEEGNITKRFVKE